MRVSVLIPTFNRADLLPETLEAILSQSYAPNEIIVVDDGSTDDTCAVVARYHPRVRYVQTQNGGVCRARNIAASQASSDLLAFCDSDDLWREDKLAKQIALHNQDVRLQFSFTNFAIVTDGKWADRTKFDEAPAGFFQGAEHAEGGNAIFEGAIYERLLEFQPIWPSTVLMTRSKYLALGGFREGFGKNPSEDWEFTLRCVEDGPIGVVTEPVVGVRRHDSNFSEDSYRNVLGQLEILEFALVNHSLSDSMKIKVRRQIEIRSIEAAYGAFRVQDFNRVLSLLQQHSNSALDRKTLIKKWISRMPLPVAKLLHGTLSN